MVSCSQALTSHEQFQTYVAWQTERAHEQYSRTSRYRAWIQVRTDLNNLLLRRFPYMRLSALIWLRYSSIASTLRVIVPHVARVGSSPCAFGSRHATRRSRMCPERGQRYRRPRPSYLICRGRPRWHSLFHPGSLTDPFTFERLISLYARARNAQAH